jgi:hypothetical protein
MTTLTIFVAWFAFGYSVTDIVQNTLATMRVNKMVKRLEELDNSRNNYDD